VLHNVDEIVYPPPADVNTILKLVDTLDDVALNSKTSEILKNHPNPYTFTKHLAEHEVVNGGLPATIVRPSISEFTIIEHSYIIIIYVTIFQTNYILFKLYVFNIYNLMYIIYIFSNRSLERANSRMDNIEEWTTRFYIRGK